MIGECPSLAPRKNSLNLCNVIMSLVAGVLMIVACASYSTKPVTVQNLAFMVLSSSYDVTTNGKTTNIKACEYIGLQAYCATSCGAVTADLPEDSPQRMCYDTPTKVTVSGAEVTMPINTFVYKAAMTAANCEGTPTNAATIIQCTLLETCQSAGNVVMAFAVLGAIGALLSMAVFAWRMNGDGVCAKLTSVVFSTGTFICCTTAFGAFQGCARQSYDLAQTSLTLSLTNPGISNGVVGVVPGVGGIMAVTSFCFFIYVMLMSIFIPGSNPTEDNAGLDNKSKV